MRTETFKVKTVNQEINIEVLVNNNVLHADVPISSHAYIEHKGNHAQLQKLLINLIQSERLSYEATSGNEQIFKVRSPSAPDIFNTQIVNIKPDSDGTMRTLEEMLYNVCQIHSIPVPAVIKPKSLLLSMYDRYMPPLSTEAQLVVSVGGAFVVAAAGTYAVRSVAKRLGW